MEEKTRPRKYNNKEIVLVFVETTLDPAISLAQTLRVMGESPRTCLSVVLALFKRKSHFSQLT